MLSHLLNKEKGWAPWEWGGTEDRGALALSSQQAQGTARILLPAWTASPILLCLWDLSPNSAQSYSSLSFMALSRGTGTPIPTQPYPTEDGVP